MFVRCGGGLGDICGRCLGRFFERLWEILGATLGVCWTALGGFEIRKRIRPQQTSYFEGYASQTFSYYGCNFFPPLVCFEMFRNDEAALSPCYFRSCHITLKRALHKIHTYIYIYIYIIRIFCPPLSFVSN